MKPQMKKVEFLNPDLRSSEVEDFEHRLLAKIIGQDRAVQRVVSIFQTFTAGMNMQDHPLSNILLLGPTGSGKTRIVEASAEILFGSPRAVTKIDCAEFQHSHEIAKLIGSPPGYLGHRETPPLLTQEAIDQYQTEKARLNFILFDEIEKANEAIWQLLLGILDKATLTLGDNRKVDFSQCVIFMTSNLGAAEMGEMLNGGIGFASSMRKNEELNKKIYRVAIDAARRNFTPEFMNRIDKTVVFETLSQDHLRKILDIELSDVQSRIMVSRVENQFIFQCTPEAKEFLLREGTDPKYGARHLKRTIEHYVVNPLSSLITTRQIELGDVIKVDLEARTRKFRFSKEISRFSNAPTQTRIRF